MGKKLVDIYDSLKSEGLTAQMRLAMLTGLASPQAATSPDSPDLIKKFRDAYKEITKKDCPII